jgi:hypothetical protein
VIVRAAQSIAGLLALFGAVLLDLAPPAPGLSGCPEGGEALNSGIASLLVLGLFLIIVGKAKSRVTSATRKAWLRRGTWLLGAAVVIAIAYIAVKGWLIVEAVPGNRVLTGLWTEAAGVAAARQEGRADRSGILAVVGCRSFQEAWSVGAVLSAYAVLMLLYLGLLFSALGCLFCVSEGVFRDFLSARTSPASRDRGHETSAPQQEAEPDSR